MTPRERKKQLKKKKSQCCDNGEVHTEEMKKQFDELQNPPPQLLQLINHQDKRIRKQFLDNTLILNNSYQFASIQTESTDNKGKMANYCKINGSSL